MYRVKNASQASTPDSSSDRRVININGTRLYPTSEMQIEELTSDVLKGLREGDLRVHRENGARVTEETLRSRGREIRSRQRIIKTSNIDGRVRKKEEELYLAEIDDTPQDAEEEASGAEASEESVSEEDDSDEEDPTEESTKVDEQNSPEDEVEGSESEGESPEDEEENPEGEEESLDNILPSLREAGAIDESVQTSSDMNAKPLRTLIGEYGVDVWPDGFFEEEDRVTVQGAIEEAQGEA